MQRFIRYFCIGRQSYYDVLGLPKTASAAEIKEAFYILSKKYHPDLSGSASSKKFISVKEAYDVLRDPYKRQFYDNRMSGFSSYGKSGYQSNNCGFNSSQEDIERILRELRRETYKAKYASYEKDEHWQNRWNDYTFKRAKKEAEESAKKYQMKRDDLKLKEDSENLWSDLFILFIVTLFVVRVKIDVILRNRDL